MATMRRTQVQLTAEQVKALRRLAAERGVSMAELIRQGVDTVLETASEPSWEEKVQRALAAAGMVKEGPTDMSERFDDYLAEAWGQPEAGSQGK
jgi:Arc/MetJ-type ribon-helix-helix transcriptional regulator